MWIRELRRTILPDWWLLDGRGDDPRLQGVEDLARDLLDAVHYARTGATCDPEETDPYGIPPPLLMASFLRSQANLIEWFTRELNEEELEAWLDASGT